MDGKHLTYLILQNKGPTSLSISKYTLAYRPTYVNIFSPIFKTLNNMSPFRFVLLYTYFIYCFRSVALVLTRHPGIIYLLTSTNQSLFTSWR